MINKLTSLIAYYRLAAIMVILRELLFQAARRAPFVQSLRTSVYDFEMLIPLKIDGIGRQLFVLRGRESDHKWMMDQEVSKGDVILDIGANIGYYALMEAKRLRGSGKVYAIEPDPRNFRFLEKNIRTFGLQNLVDVREGAISNIDGELEFALSSRTNLSGFNTAAATASSIIKVTVHDFGAYVERIGHVNLVRMDVEGHEVQILDSLVALLERNKSFAPTKIIFETHQYADKQERMAEILGALLGHGYKVKYISSDDELAPQGSIFKTYGYTPFKVLDEWRVSRGLYCDIAPDDAVRMISNWRGTRTVCLEFSPAEQKTHAQAVSATE